MRITDTQYRSYWNKDYQKVLAQQEREKKNQYLCPCLEMRKDFTPRVYSVDDIAGRETKNVKKRLTYHLFGEVAQTPPPDDVLYLGPNGHCHGMLKQPSDPWQQGSATSPLPFYL